jgi:hypothetical protein
MEERGGKISVACRQVNVRRHVQLFIIDPLGVETVWPMGIGLGAWHRPACRTLFGAVSELIVIVCQFKHHLTGLRGPSFRQTGRAFLQPGRSSVLRHLCFGDP